MSKLINPSHFFKAAGYSLAGLRQAWKNEQAFKHEVLVLPILLLCLILTGKSFGIWMLALGAWLLVMAIELLNSAIEQAFDMISLEQDIRIKQGKDMASAAIFLAITANVGLWIYIFIC